MAIVKSILLNVFTGASATIAVLTVLVGYSDHLHPGAHPVLACAGMTFPFFLIVNLIMFMVWLMVRWQRAWIPLLAFLLAFPAIRVYIPLHTPSSPPPGSIKVLSYNVACYTLIDKYRNPLDTIASYLERQQADIVCLQEDVNIRLNPEERMAAIYPYNDTVHVNIPSSPLINAIGMHSRYPILRKERIDYESYGNGSVAFYLQVGDDTVIVVNNHLESTHLSESDRQRYNDMIRGGMNGEDAKAETRLLIGKLSTAMVKRAPQAEAVARYIDCHRHYPIIVCGDFNDTPISYTRLTIAQGLTDCYVESGCGPGVSFNRSGFFFRIDQMMCSDHFEPYGCYVDNDMDASDHYPVICWLKWR